MQVPSTVCRHQVSRGLGGRKLDSADARLFQVAVAATVADYIYGFERSLRAATEPQARPALPMCPAYVELGGSTHREDTESIGQILSSWV